MAKHVRVVLGNRWRVGCFAGVVACALVLLAMAAIGALTDGRRHLESAERQFKSARHLLGERRYDEARAQLASAGIAVNSAQYRSRATSLRLLGVVPLVGSPARSLATFSRAGEELLAAADIVVDEAEALETGLASADRHELAAVNKAVERSVRAVDDVTARIGRAKQTLGGPAGALLATVSGPAKDMRARLGEELADLDRLRAQLAVAGDLTGPDTDVRLLVLAQDTMELRPTGGYIGSFGVLHIAGGTVELERYASFEELPPPSPPLAAPNDLATALEHPWSLSNANWWPDFPTSVRAARELFARQGGGEVDGVVAVTEEVLARLIGVVGPVKLPDYAEPVVEEGFAQRVLWEVELKRPQDRPRKKFLSDLAAAMLVHLLDRTDASQPVLEVVTASAEAGDIQVWFADPERQAVVEGTGVAGTLPRTDGDFLLLSEANMSASKANADLVKEADYTVRRGPDGRLHAELRIDYRNEGVPSAVNPYYHGWLKVYVPRGSLPTGGLPVEVRPAEDGPYDTFFTKVYVPPSETAEVRIEYLLPASVGEGGRYSLRWLRQVGTPGDRLRAEVGGVTATGNPARRQMELTAHL